MSTDASDRIAEAAQLRRGGRLDEARGLLLGVVAEQRDRVDAYSLLAQIDLDQRRWESALDCARSALALRRSEATAWYVFARAHKELGKLDAAIACYRRATALEPRNPTFLTSLGTALYLVGRRDQAIRTYRAALTAYPQHAGARASLDQLTQAAPGDERSLAQIREEALRQHRAGKLAEALDLHHEALRVVPQFAGIWYSAGSLLNDMGRQHESLPYFEEAARLEPSLFPAVEAARRICVAAGLLGKAVRYSEQAYALRPSEDIRVARALTVSAIQPSVEAIQAARGGFERALDSAIAANLQVHEVAAQGMGSFFLAYHGQSNCELQLKAARLLSAPAAAPSIQAAHCTSPVRRAGKIRIGFLSAFLFSHSIGSTTRGLVTELCREKYEVFVLRITPSKSDEVTELLRRAADTMIDLDPDYLLAQQQIAALELDILFYQDIGMEPMSYRLALCRLAPVQCVSFGHPDTTGIATMDYFVSNDLFEPEDGASHYTEKLFLLEDLPTLAYYYRPEAPAIRPERAAFGLHEEDHVYLCPQTLFKIHPEFDQLLGGILRGDPAGVLILIRAQYDDYTDQLQQRFSLTLPDVADRIVFLDRMGSKPYMQLLSIADVCLDTLHFNGMNSSLESFSVGTPIVTLPGRMQRGRHTQAMYRKMGILECIAQDPQDYVDIALRLGCNRAYAQALRDRILARSSVLFEDRRVVTEFERFFLHAVREARPDYPWPAAER